MSMRCRNSSRMWVVLVMSAVACYQLHREVLAEDRRSWSWSPRHVDIYVGTRQSHDETEPRARQRRDTRQNHVETRQRHVETRQRHVDGHALHWKLHRMVPDSGLGRWNNSMQSWSDLLERGDERGRWWQEVRWRDRDLPALLKSSVPQHASAILSMRASVERNDMARYANSWNGRSWAIPTGPTV